MKKRKWALCLVSILILLTACSAETSNTTQAKAVASASPTAKATLGSTTTLSPTPSSTPSPTPTPIPGYVPDGAIRNLGRGKIYDISVSPDGSFIAVGSVGGVYILNGESYYDVTFIPNDDSNYIVDSVDFSPNGDYLLVSANTRGIGDSFFYLIDTTVWQVLQKLTLPARVSPYQAHSTVALSPTEDIAAIILHGNVSTWNYRSGDWDIIYTAPSDGYTYDLEFTNTGYLLIATGKRLLLLDPTNGQILKRYESQFDNWVYGVAISHDSKLIGAYQFDKFVVMKLDTGEIVLEDDNIDVSSLYSPDSLFSNDDNAVYFGYQGEVISWSIADGTRADSYSNSELEQPPYFYQDASLFPDGRIIFSSTKQDLTVWATESGKMLRNIAPFSNGVGNIDVSPDGTNVVLQSTLYDLGSGEKLHEFPFEAYGNGFGVFSNFSPSGRYLGITAWADGQIYDLNNYKQLCNFGGNVPVVWFSPDEEFFAFPTGVNFNIARMSDCEIITSFDSVSEGSTFGISSDWQYVFESDETNVYVYNLQSKELIFTFTGLGGIAQHFATTEDGQYLAVSTPEGRARSQRTLIFNLENGKQVGKINSTMFGQTPYGRPTPNMITNNLLGTSGSIWDMEQGKNIAIFNTSHYQGNQIESATVSPDGQIMAMIGFDGRPNGKTHIYIVNPISGALLYEYFGHSGLDFLIFTMEFAPDSQELITGANDGSVLVWDTSH